MELLKYKVKEENQRKLIDQRRELVFNRNYGQKILDKLNQKTNNKSKNGMYSKIKIKNRSKNIPLDEFISLIKQNFKENPLDYESIDMTNTTQHYRFSICFICQNPVIAFKDKVICTNRCFNFNIKTSTFSDDYTLDNFKEQYYEFCKEHKLCLGDVKLIYIDPKAKKSFFICEICDKETLDRAGIIL